MKATSAAAEARIKREPIELSSGGEAIFEALQNGSLNETQLRAVAYCAQCHLADGFCDDPDVYLVGEGGVFGSYSF